MRTALQIMSNLSFLGSLDMLDSMHARCKKRMSPRCAEFREYPQNCFFFALKERNTPRKIDTIIVASKSNSKRSLTEPLKPNMRLISIQLDIGLTTANKGVRHMGLFQIDSLGRSNVHIECSWSEHSRGILQSVLDLNHSREPSQCCLKVWWLIASLRDTMESNRQHSEARHLFIYSTEERHQSVNLRDEVQLRSDCGNLMTYQKQTPSSAGTIRVAAMYQISDKRSVLTVRGGKALCSELIVLCGFIIARLQDLPPREA